MVFVPETMQSSMVQQRCLAHEHKNLGLGLCDSEALLHSEAYPPGGGAGERAKGTRVRRGGTKMPFVFSQPIECEALSWGGAGNARVVSCDHHRGVDRLYQLLLTYRETWTGSHDPENTVTLPASGLRTSEGQHVVDAYRSAYACERGPCSLRRGPALP